MNFKDFYKHGHKSTKENCHRYITHYYNNEFTDIRNEELNILEIGTREGESLVLWKEWFINSKIYGIDINGGEFKDINFKSIDGYTQEALDLYEDNFFDYIIDDGPHTIESQQYAITNWYKKLKSKGKLIIEDIGCIDEVSSPPESSDYALNELIKVIPNNINYKVFDLREFGQYDSIILEITKQ
jgi:ubiquinone/menaquinone biosynthesis C-methylase UbiE